MGWDSVMDRAERNAACPYSQFEGGYAVSLMALARGPTWPDKVVDYCLASQLIPAALLPQDSKTDLLDKKLGCPSLPVRTDSPHRISVVQ